MSLLAWLPALRGRPREDRTERASWSDTNPTTWPRPATAARFASVRRLQRTPTLRPADRRAARQHGPSLAPDETGRLGTVDRRPPNRRRPRGPVPPGSGASELAFPFDATAPPARP